MLIIYLVRNLIRNTISISKLVFCNIAGLESCVTKPFNLIMDILLLTLFTFIINIPFGYWRANVQKYSLQFFLAIHIPVLLIIAFRILSVSEFEITTFLFTVPAFFLGQLAGSKIYSSRKLREAFPLTSCLVMDIIRSNTE